MFIAPKQLEQTLIAKSTKMKRLFRGTFLQSHGNVNKPPIHEAYIVTFVENLIPLSLDFCEDKLYHKINLHINIQNMMLSRVS